jgi:tripartite-type tricarboxylate transporter receptor subunit TctC
LATLGFGPLVRTPEDFAHHIKAESAEWARVVRDAKIKID